MGSDLDNFAQQLTRRRLAKLLRFLKQAQNQPLPVESQF